jgi:hypothetical protein
VLHMCFGRWSRVATLQVVWAATRGVQAMAKPGVPFNVGGKIKKPFPGLGGQMEEFIPPAPAADGACDSSEATGYARRSRTGCPARTPRARGLSETHVSATCGFFQGGGQRDVPTLPIGYLAARQHGLLPPQNSHGLAMRRVLPAPETPHLPTPLLNGCLASSRILEKNLAIPRYTIGGRRQPARRRLKGDNRPRERYHGHRLRRGSPP